MTTIITKNGSGAPTAGQLSEGELAVDLTNKELYTKSGSTVIKIGGTGGGETGTFTDLTATSSFTSPGIDDNANATAITIDANENVGIGTDSPDQTLHVHKGSAGAVGSQANSVLTLENSGSAILQFLTPNTADQQIRFGDPQDNGAGYLNYSHAVGSMTFGVNGPERMRIDASGNVGIGSSNPSASLHVAETASGLTARFSNESNQTLDIGTVAGSGAAGSVYLDNANSGNMQFRIGGNERMRINASGTTTVSGHFKASQPGAGADAFAAGTDAGAINQATNGVAIGNAAGYTGQGTHSVAVGLLAGRTDQGDNSTAVGRGAGTTTQGSAAVSVGYLAGETTQGGNAVAMGVVAGQSNQGFAAIGVGSSAGKINQGENAVAMGRDAGEGTQGQRSVAVGSYSAQTNQGEFSVALGDSAGKTNQGNFAVAVGHLAGNSGQLNGAIAIGYNAGTLNQQTNSIAIGNSAGSVNQGAGGIIISSQGTAQQSTGPNHIVFRSPTGLLAYNGTNAWTFDGGAVVVPNNSLLVGTTSQYSGALRAVFGVQSGGTACEMHNSGGGAWTAIRFHTASTLAGYISVATNTTAYNTSSDERLKENVVDAPAGNIDSIKVRSFDWKSDGEHQDYGFIAQELETVAPYAVSKGETDEDMWAVDYSKLVPMLVKEIQDLKAEVAALKGA